MTKSLAVPRVKVADSVAERLRYLILSGELADGSPLRQDALAEQMGTSRIPVREALARLENEGLVTSYPHRGYVVTGLSRNEIIELFDLRSMLEPQLIQYAIPQLTPEDIAHAREILDAYDKALNTDDIHNWGELNRRFHMALYTPSRRPKTLEIVRGLLLNADRYTRLILTVGDGTLRAKEEHASMLDLCCKGSINEAVALTRYHIEKNGSELLNTVLKRDADAA
jgi:DNA-binding GntR family transcriptional regulator